MTSLSQQSPSSSPPEHPTSPRPAPATPPVAATAAARRPLEAHSATVERPVWASYGLRIVAGLVSLGVLAWLLWTP